MRVKLEIPADKMRSAQFNGEHFAYNGQSGTLLAGAGEDGAWVRFDGQAGYVGCPLKWLKPEA